MIIPVTQHWRRLSWGFALDVVQSYKDNLKENSKALAFAYGDHDPADEDPLVQHAGRLAEIGMAIYLGLDPLEALDWNAKKCDRGFDINYDGLLIDVKSSPHPYAKLLIWPFTKNHIFDQSPAHVLAFVPIEQSVPKEGNPDFRGWIWKHEFKKRHKVANGTIPNDKIHPGTRYMHQDDLHHVEEFPDPLFGLPIA